MNRLARPASFLAFVALVLCMLPSLFAQSPFDGSWGVNLDQSKLSQRPSAILLSNGISPGSSQVPHHSPCFSGCRLRVRGRLPAAARAWAETKRFLARP